MVGCITNRWPFGKRMNLQACIQGHAATNLGFEYMALSFLLKASSLRKGCGVWGLTCVLVFVNTGCYF